MFIQFMNNFNRMILIKILNNQKMLFVTNSSMNICNFKLKMELLHNIFLVLLGSLSMVHLYLF